MRVIRGGEVGQVPFDLTPSIYRFWQIDRKVPPFVNLLLPNDTPLTYLV